jgi:hypothetical protein
MGVGFNHSGKCVIGSRHLLVLSPVFSLDLITFAAFKIARL